MGPKRFVTGIGALALVWAQPVLADKIEVQLSPVNKTVVGTYSPFQIVVDGVIVSSSKLRLDKLSINQQKIAPGPDGKRFFYQTAEDSLKIQGSFSNGSPLQPIDIQLPKIQSARMSRRPDGISNEIVFLIANVTQFNVDGVKIGVADREARWVIPTTESSEGSMHSVELLGPGGHRRIYNLTWQDPTANVSDRCSSTQLKWSGFQADLLSKQAQVQSRWKWLKVKGEQNYEAPVCRTWIKLPKGFGASALSKPDSVSIRPEDSPFLLLPNDVVVSWDSNLLSDSISLGMKTARGESGIAQVSLSKATGKPSLLAHPQCDSASLFLKTRVEGGDHLYAALFCQKYESETEIFFLSSPESTISQSRFDKRVEKKRNVAGQKISWKVLDTRIKNAFTMAAFRVGKTGESKYSDYSLVKTKEEVSEANIVKVHSIVPSIGASYIRYTETDKQAYTATAVTVKLAYTWFAFPPHWNLGLSTFFTAFTISQNLPGVTVRFMGFNLRGGYTVPSVRPPWRLMLGIGYYYTTMDVSGTKLGFKGVGGPQLFPSVRYRLNLDQSISGYAKFSPVNDAFKLLDFSSYELAGGLGWLHRVGDSQELGFHLDYSDMKLKLPRKDGSIQEGVSRTVSLSVGYGF